MSQKMGVEKAPGAPQLFGNAGVEHMQKYGTNEMHFAKIGWKNHKHRCGRGMWSWTGRRAGAKGRRRDIRAGAKGRRRDIRAGAKGGGRGYRRDPCGQGCRRGPSLCPLPVFNVSCEQRLMCLRALSSVNNPYSQFQEEYSLDEVANARKVFKVRSQATRLANRLSSSSTPTRLSSSSPPTPPTRLSSSSPPTRLSSTSQPTLLTVPRAFVRPFVKPVPDPAPVLPDVGRRRRRDRLQRGLCSVRLRTLSAVAVSPKSRLTTGLLTVANLAASTVWGARRLRSLPRPWPPTAQRHRTAP